MIDEDFVEMKPGKHFEPNQYDEFWAEMKKRANRKPIVGHMYGGLINYYIENYHPDNRIGQDTGMCGSFIWEKVKDDS